MRRARVVPCCPIRPGDLVAQRGHVPPHGWSAGICADGYAYPARSIPGESWHVIGRVRSVRTADGVAHRVYLAESTGPWWKLDNDAGPIRPADRRERQLWRKRTAR